jgi:DEAD/DEAH box helicase domain-containing protein
LSKQAFERAPQLMAHTLDVINACACEDGCPSCVHSPKCGSGNRPINKAAAIFILESLEKTQIPRVVRPSKESNKITAHPRKSMKATRIAAVRPKHAGRLKRRLRKRKAASMEKPKNQDPLRKAASMENPKNQSPLMQNKYYGVFDVETQRSAQEVGGWHRADLMGISCAVLYDSKKDEFFEFLEDQVPQLIENLQQFEVVVGFNIKRFDYRVLSGYSDFDFNKLPTLDILEEVHKRLGYRLSLDHLARVTLGAKKTADGLQALRWWKQGRIREIIDYCKADVAITRDLLIYGITNSYLLFQNKAGNTVRIPVDWMSSQ